MKSKVVLPRWMRKICTLVALGLLLGWVYDWVGPRMYPKGRDLGFGYGMLHGGFMPMAMPALVMGRNVEIFSANNDGRLYKLGYIAGINLCGMIFFGAAFWRRD